MVSTHLKNISQIGSFPHIKGENRKHLKAPASILSVSCFPFRCFNRETCWGFNRAFFDAPDKRQVANSPAAMMCTPPCKPLQRIHNSSSDTGCLHWGLGFKWKNPRARHRSIWMELGLIMLNNSSRIIFKMPGAFTNTWLRQTEYPQFH